MRIKCIENKVTKLPEEIINNYSISNSTFSVLIGKEYVVYGMTVHLGYVWYYICDESYSYYPTWSPSPLFDVIDGQLSRFWIYSYKEGERTTLSPWWTFPEWADNPDFYDKLTDGEEQEVKIFQYYKELMDLEYPNQEISEIAQVGDNEWLICPTCLDAWKFSNGRDGMVKCPKCKNVMQNPRYKANLPSEQSIKVDTAYRPNAEIGSGSTAVAIRFEKMTGEMVRDKLHSQKGEELINRLEGWLRQNPTASQGGRAAAENIILDLKNALE